MYRKRQTFSFSVKAFAFIRQLLVILLQHGLDPNVRFSQRTQHILLSLMDMVMNARSPADLDHVYALTLTLLQYRADPNVHIATTEPMICHSQSSVFLKKSSHQVLYYYVQVWWHSFLPRERCLYLVFH